MCWDDFAILFVSKNIGCTVQLSSILFETLEENYPGDQTFAKFQDKRDFY